MLLDVVEAIAERFNLRPICGRDGFSNIPRWLEAPHPRRFPAAITTSFRSSRLSSPTVLTLVPTVAGRIAVEDRVVYDVFRRGG